MGWKFDFTCKLNKVTKYYICMHHKTASNQITCSLIRRLVADAKVNRGTNVVLRLEFIPGHIYLINCPLNS